MDPRTEVPREVRDESSEDESRLSPGTPSIDDDMDPNSKKRKRGSYRCSRCGMPKRGHNCPDNFEGVHFAIVESPSPAATTPAPKSGTTSQTATPPFVAKHSFDDCNRETLLMHLNALHEENMRLRHENMQLHEVCQFQAHTIQSMHPHPNPTPDFSHGANGPPVIMHAGGPHNGAAMFSPGPPALPNFSPAFQHQPHQPADVLHHSHRPNFTNLPAQQPTLLMGPAKPVDAPHQAFRAPPPPPHDSLVHQHLPAPKRAKLQETFFNHAPSSSVHHFSPISAPFPPDHLSEAERQVQQFPQAAVSMDHSSYDFGYNRHDWFDNDSSTSDYSPSLESSPTLIY